MVKRKYTLSVLKFYISGNRIIYQVVTLFKYNLRYTTIYDILHYTTATTEMKPKGKCSV